MSQQIVECSHCHYRQWADSAERKLVCPRCSSPMVVNPTQEATKPARTGKGGRK